MESAGISRWRQFEDTLMQEIRSGRRTPGEKLPSEMDLAARFGVSRQTVRRALSHMQEIGVINSEHGRGTFVTTKVLDYRLEPKMWFEQNLAANTSTPSRRIVYIRTIPASEKVASALDIPEGREVILAAIIGKGDGVHLTLGLNYFCEALTPGIGDAMRELEKVPDGKFSITATLRTLGVVDQQRRNMRLRARPATMEEVNYLHIPQNECVIETEVLSVDGANRPVMFSVHAYASSRVEFTLDFMNGRT